MENPELLPRNSSLFWTAVIGTIVFTGMVMVIATSLLVDKFL